MRPLTRAFLKWTRTLHIYLSVFALLALLFFAATGFMLLHYDWFDHSESTPIEGKVPLDLLTAPLNEDRLARHLRDQFGLAGRHKFDPVDEHKAEDDKTEGNHKAEDEQAEDDKTEGSHKAEGEHKRRVVFKSPGRTVDLTIDLQSGEVKGECESNGLAALLTDLHKGKEENTSTAWRRVVDAVSILLMLISLTGLFLWASLRKRLVLGLVALFAGIVIPTAIFFIFVA